MDIRSPILFLYIMPCTKLTHINLCWLVLVKILVHYYDGKRDWFQIKLCIWLLNLPCLAHEVASSWILPLIPTLYTYFFIYFYYFTLQVNPRTETIQGASPPRPMTCSTRNGRLRSASTMAQYRVIKKTNVCRSYSSKNRDFHSWSW